MLTTVCKEHTVCIKNKERKQTNKINEKKEKKRKKERMKARHVIFINTLTVGIRYMALYINVKGNRDNEGKTLKQNKTKQ